jgi:hypothetical protein
MRHVQVTACFGIFRSPTNFSSIPELYKAAGLELIFWETATDALSNHGQDYFAGNGRTLLIIPAKWRRPGKLDLYLTVSPGVVSDRVPDIRARERIRLYLVVAHLVNVD